MTIGLLAVAMPASWVGAGEPNNPPIQLKVDDAALDRSQTAPLSFAPVAKRVAPSVVSIYSTMTIHGRGGHNPLSDDPLFRHFFGDDFDQNAQTGDRKAESLGSGVVIAPNGYILTASHVVAGADSVKVAFSQNDKEYDAKVIGTDPPTDVAVLKINADQELPVLPLGNSDQLEVGDIVLAVGNPFGVGKTVTMGIISGLGRSGFDVNGYEDFIQTDAAINPGNSGGALVDAAGRLVGINTAILSRSGGFQGVGFAVPVNMARYVMNRLIKYGKVTRGQLGISIQKLTPDLAKELNLPDHNGGVLVGGVLPNSAAARAGLQEGDVITQFNGKKVADPRNLQLLVAQTAPGTKVTLNVLRGENGGRPRERTFTATLGELRGNEVAGADEARPRRQAHQSMDALAGVEVTDLDGATRRHLEVPPAIHGALVVSVDENSKAAEEGLQPGDVIVEMNHRPVRSAADAAAFSERAKGNRILLRVWSSAGDSQGGTRYMVIENARNQ